MEGAHEKAQKDLSNTHPVRLQIALGLSVFYEVCIHWIKGKKKQYWYSSIQKLHKEKAVEVSKRAFDDAISQLDALGEDSYKDSTLIVQQIRYQQKTDQIY